MRNWANNGDDGLKGTVDGLSQTVHVITVGTVVLRTMADV